MVRWLYGLDSKKYCVYVFLINIFDKVKEVYLVSVPLALCHQRQRTFSTLFLAVLLLLFKM